MSDSREERISVQHRIADILRGDGTAGRAFAPVEQAEEVDELEFRLAEAEMELRAARARVESLRRELQQKLGRSSSG